MKQSFFSPLAFMLLVIVIAVLAAVTTSVATNQSLQQYADDFEYRFSALQRASAGPITLPGTYEEALEALSLNTMPSLAYVTGPGVETFLPGEQLATAVAVTADGWMLLMDAEGIDINRHRLWIGEGVYVIEDIRRDVYSTAALLKVNASNLRAIAFGRSELAPSGSLLFSVSAARDIYPGSLESARQYGGEITEAEELPYTWGVSEYLPEGFLFDASGALIGWKGARTAHPVHSMLPFVDATLRGREEVYAGLGAMVRGGYTVGDDIETTQVEVLLTTDASSVLQEGDVLLRFDDMPFGAMTLGDFLLLRRPGETVVIDFQRNGEELREIVGLRARSSLIY